MHVQSSLAGTACCLEALMYNRTLTAYSAPTGNTDLLRNNDKVMRPIDWCSHAVTHQLHVQMLTLVSPTTQLS